MIGSGFSLQGDFNFSIRFDKGRWRAEIKQWDGDLIIHESGKTEIEAWGKTMVKLQQTVKRGGRE